LTACDHIWLQLSFKLSNVDYLWQKVKFTQLLNLRLDGCWWYALSPLSLHR